MSEVNELPELKGIGGWLLLFILTRTVVGLLWDACRIIRTAQILPGTGRGTAQRWRGLSLPIAQHFPNLGPLRQATPATSPCRGGL